MRMWPPAGRRLQFARDSMRADEPGAVARLVLALTITV